MVGFLFYEEGAIAMNPILRKVLLPLATLVSIPIVLGLVFLPYAAITNFYTSSINLRLYPGLIIGFLILVVLSWIIFRSKLASLYKMIYTTVPVSMVLAAIIVFCSDKGWAVLGYSLDAIFLFGVLAYLFFTKKPWLYYLSVIVSVILVVIVLFVTEP